MSSARAVLGRGPLLGLILCCQVVALACPAQSQAVGTGVVIDTVSEPLAKAGVQPGDVFHAWERLPRPSAASAALEERSGQLASPVDWEWLVIEQTRLSPVRLRGERDGRPLAVEVPVGNWGATRIHPVLPADLLTLYRGCLGTEKEKSAPDASACWADVVKQIPPVAPWQLKSWLSFRIGRSLAGLRAWREAEEAYEVALTTARDLRFKALIWQEMADSYEKQGRLDAAMETIQQAYAAQAEVDPMSWSVASSLKKLGRFCLGKGDVDAAEDHIRRALAIEQEIAPASLGIAESHQLLAVIYYRRSNKALAADALEKSLAHLSLLGKGHFLAFTQGHIARLRGDAASAKRSYIQALQGLPDRDQEGEFEILSELGDLALEAGHLIEAEEHMRRARALVVRLGPTSAYSAQAALSLGNLLLARGDVDQAESHLREAVELSRQVAPFMIRRAEALRSLASVARRKGSPERAEQLLAEALEVVEGQIERLGGSLEDRGKFRAQQRDVYRDALALQLELGRPREAFAILERFRAQAFLALMGERDLTFADVPPALDRERRSVIATYDRDQLRLATLDPERDRPEIAELQRSQAELRRRRDEVAAEIRRAAPHLGEAIRPQALTFEQVQAALDSGTVMLSYSVGRERSHLFVIAPGREIQVVTLEVGESVLQADVERLRQLLDQTRTGAGLSAEGLGWFSRRLYRLLVAPAEPWIAGSERLLVVPDGPLHLLPFGALARERAAGEAGERDWQYLVEWKPLHTVLSGTVYAELRKQRRGPGDTAGSMAWVAFGDPSFPEHLARSPSRDIGEIRLRSLVTRTQLRWERLPQSRREVEGIAGLFPTGQGRAYLGEEATEERAKAVGRETRILHFATHAFLDDRSPFDSGLVLAIPEKLVEGRDNGLLQVWEIFERVRLDADLVVLSACETGLGEIRGGEGIIGLTRAFQLAGARSVLTTLWRVEDAATAELMQRFYRHLRAGSTKAEALRAAQLELIQGPLQRPDGPPLDATAPYFWAGVQLVGDGR